MFHPANIGRPAREVQPLKGGSFINENMKNEEKRKKKADQLTTKLHFTFHFSLHFTSFHFIPLHSTSLFINVPGNLLRQCLWNKVSHCNRNFIEPTRNDLILFRKHSVYCKLGYNICSHNYL